MDKLLTAIGKFWEWVIGAKPDPYALMKEEQHKQDWRDTLIQIEDKRDEHDGHDEHETKL